MRLNRRFIGNVAGLLFALLLVPFSAAQAPAVQRLENARIDAIDKNFAFFTVTDCPAKCDGAVVKVTAKDAMQTKLKTFQVGDHVTIDINGEKVLQSIAVRSIAVSASTRIWVLLLAFAIYFGVSAILTLGHPFRLIIGEDNRYSNSKFQMALWFAVVISTYLATLYLRISQAGWEFLGNINIPQNLFLLSGMSALTYGGAKAITTAKVNAAVAAGTPNPKPAGQSDILRDLVQNDANAVDFGDFQMLLITLLAVGTYLAAVFNFMGSVDFFKAVDLPSVDTTILASFGLGHGAYLTKKAAGDVRTS